MDEVYQQLPLAYPPAVMRFARVNFDEEFHRRFLAMHDHVCAYCGGCATSIDHFVPVFLGGSNHPSNLYPACQSCNSTAGWKLFESFTEKQRFVLTRRFENGTLPDLSPAPAHEYATCVDCGAPYRFASDATIFLCPICRYMDEHRPLPAWRRKRIDGFLSREFPLGAIRPE